jgi:hypothetical protein
VSKVDVGGTVTAGISDLVGKNGSIGFSSKVNLEKNILILKFFQPGKKCLKLLRVYPDKKNKSLAGVPN